MSRTADRSENRSQANQVAHRRSALLKISTLAAERFLKSAQVAPNIMWILAELGKATGSARVFIAQNHCESGQTFSSEQYEWTAPGPKSPASHPHRKKFDYAEHGLDHWTAQLSAHQVLSCDIQTCTLAERETLIAFGVQAIVLAPIFVGPDWWGVLGFDDFPLEQPSSAPYLQNEPLREIDALTATANVIGAALQNTQLHREIQKRVQLLASLHEVGHAIGSTLGLEEIAQLAIEHTCELFQAPIGTIFLADLIADTAQQFAAVGRPASPTACLPLQDSLVGQVVITGRPVFFERAMPSDPAVDAPAHGQVESAAMIPLSVGEHVLGALNVAFANPRSFSIDEQTLLSAIGRQVGMALANARLFQEIQSAEQATRRQAQQILALHDVARIVNEGHDLDHTLDLLLEQLARLVAYDSAAVFLHTGGYFTVAAGKGFPDLDAVLTLHIHVSHDTLLQEVASTHKPLALDDAQQDERFDGWAGTQYVRGWVGSPLLVGTELVGILTVDSRQPGAFDEKHVDLIQALADQVAVAIHKARLVDELQKANLELRQLDELKDQFIQNVAHELRTPLTLVRGYVEMLTDEDVEQAIKHQAIQTALNHTKRLVRLVEGITTIQDLSLGEFERTPVDLDELIQTVLQVVHQQAVRANVHLQVDYPRYLPPLMGDYIWLAQALFQLLDNAIKFSPDGGNVILRLSADLEARVLLVEVEDQGIGILPEEQKRIFELFYQSDGTTTRRFGGTGLGLAIVQRVVKRHDGRVWVESPVENTGDQPPAGSRFTIRLPYHTATTS